MEIKQYGWLAGGIGLAIVVAFFLFGGGVNVRNGIFWVGVVLLLLGLVVSFSEVTTWSAVGLRFVIISILPLVVGYFMSTAALVVGGISLVVGLFLFFVLRGEAKPAGR
jgi:hypothetical protein